jgi:type IV secretory pathway VirB2 component (pilin)
VQRRGVVVALFLGLFLLFPQTGYATVESTLQAIQTELIGKLLPVAAILGLIVAGFSFVMGHQNARSHLILAVIGAIIGFGAPSIVALIRSLVH